MSSRLEERVGLAEEVKRGYLTMERERITGSDRDRSVRE